MATRRKAHPDHYQVRPVPYPDKSAYRRAAEELKAPSGMRGPASGARGESRIMAGERLRRARLLICDSCGSETPFLAGQRIETCPGCGGSAYRAPISTA